MAMQDKSRLWEQGEDHTVEVNQRALIDSMYCMQSQFKSGLFTASRYFQRS